MNRDKEILTEEVTPDILKESINIVNSFLKEFIRGSYIKDLDDLNDYSIEKLKLLHNIFLASYKFDSNNDVLSNSHRRSRYVDIFRTIDRIKFIKNNY